jgi:hypothetical protein
MSIPFGWENTLIGFQSQFYFLLLFSFLFIWAMSKYKTNSIGWFFGLTTGILSTLSLASGAITLVTGFIIITLKNIFDKRQSKEIIFPALIILCISIFTIALTPKIEQHQLLKTHSVLDFLFGFLKIAAWPTKNPIFSIIIQGPFFIFTYLFYFFF